MLYQIEQDGPRDQPTLLIVHGLFGSARNWGAVAKRLCARRRVVAVDMRNHGLSPRFNTHNYEDMAADLAEVITSINGPVDVLGHSMGGKAAMVCALHTPTLVNRLIVADIAPIAYGHTQMGYIDAMKAVDLTQVDKRSDAVAMLAKTVEDPALCSFFTQSLDLKEKRWRLNLDVLADQMPFIMNFPEIAGTYQGKTLFLSGGESDYVGAQHRRGIKRLFPLAQFANIKGAGHWLHAQKPREFIATVDAWLGG